MDEILKEKEMVVMEPTETEKKSIRTKFDYSFKKLSYWDIMMGIFKTLKIEKTYHEKLMLISKEMEMADTDPETLL